MVAASRRMFSALRMAPVIGTAKWASNISGMLGSMAATVSPLVMPSLASALARRRQRSPVWPQVMRRVPWITAMRFGWTASVRDR